MEKTRSKLPEKRTGGAKALGIRTPMEAIRAKCRDCTCDQAQEIRDCATTTCALWPYRMGRRPTA